MSRNLAFALVLAFLIASSIMAAKPVSGQTATDNSWVERAPMQVARADLGVAVVNGKIYAIGGTNQSLQTTSIPNPFPVGENPVGVNEQYDPATNNWTFKAPMPDPRVSFAIAVYQGKIYCIGGLGSNKLTEVYDPTTDTWETKAPILALFWPMQASVVNDKIYVVGGSPDISHNEVYDPAIARARTNLPHRSSGRICRVEYASVSYSDL